MCLCVCVFVSLCVCVCVCVCVSCTVKLGKDNGPKHVVVTIDTKLYMRSIRYILNICKRGHCDPLSWEPINFSKIDI